MADLVGTGWPVPEGQVRYVRTRAWWMAGVNRRRRHYAYLAENLLQQWIPFDPADDWLLDRRLTGRRIWLSGDADQAAADGVDLTPRWPTGRWRAPYGNFFAPQPDRHAWPEEGWWQMPTPEFLASLPRDPRRLLARLRTDSPSDQDSYNGPMTYARDLLRSGFVPADLRGSLYAALQLISGVSAGSPPIEDGRPGRSLSFDDGRVRTDILIDLDDGEFRGERQTLTRSDPDLGLPSGTVITDAAVTVATVKQLGAAPT